MKGPKYKYDSIDLMQLYSRGDVDKWNRMLNDHMTRRDANGLSKIWYGMQRGMDDLAKHGHNTAKVCYWYLRCLNSLEKTMRAILRARHPNPYNDPKSAALCKAEKDKKWLEVKRRRDAELAVLMKKISF